MSLPRVAGVRFRNAGRIQYFHTAGLRLEPGEYVIVETVRGPEVAKVVIAPDQVVVNELGDEELKPILRLATEDDLRRADELRAKAQELLPEARALAAETGMPARIDGAEFTLDGRRLTFSFTSEERIDYREFVRRAADRFGVRIDMRQMGARDRARMAGGYGICGRELCCANWLTTFPSISIRMAKEQELPLNPQKISGLCGRLLCCLSYEEEGYKEMRRTLPKVGQRCSTPTGEGKVIAVNILRRQVTLFVDGARVEVGDRDLGTVVRWDASSKAAEPPPSISRADAIAAGMIEADELDLRLAAGETLEEELALAPGRGRLPGGGPRKTVRAKPAAETQAPATAPRAPGPRPGSRGSEPAPAAVRAQRSRPVPQPPREGPAVPSRVFQRSAPPPPLPAAADGEDDDEPAGETLPPGRRRGRRGGRGGTKPGA